MNVQIANYNLFFLKGKTLQAKSSCWDGWIKIQDIGILSIFSKSFHVFYREKYFVAGLPFINVAPTTGFFQSVYEWAGGNPVLASLYLGGFFTVCALFGKGVNVYAYKIPNNTYSTPTTPLNEDLGGSRYDIQSSTENIMPQVEALNPNLGGKPFNFTSKSLYFDVLHSIPKQIRAEDSFSYILGLGKIEFTPLFFNLNMYSDLYRYCRFRAAFKDFIYGALPEKHTISQYAVAHARGISQFRTNANFTRKLIYYTDMVSPEFGLDEVVQIAQTIPIIYLS